VQNINTDGNNTKINKNLFDFDLSIIKLIYYIYWQFIWLKCLIVVTLNCYKKTHKIPQFN